MAQNKKVNLMLTKEQLMKAVAQAPKVKDKYPEYWAFCEMCQEINIDLLDKNYQDLEGK